MADSQSRHLVVGLGEVGAAIKTILEEKYPVEGLDPGLGVFPQSTAGFDVIHICIPFQAIFDTHVRTYQKIYGKGDSLTIIHSTVELGTTEKIKDAVHSPVRGIHPYLIEGIKTFVKFFGGERAEEARWYFENVGIKTVARRNARDTEALKLCDTLQYGVSIRLEKEIKEYCDKNGLDFDFVYTLGNTSYNEGYNRLGHPEFTRPVLKDMPGKIGGHCVMENAKMTEIKIAKELTDFDMLK